MIFGTLFEKTLTAAPREPPMGLTLAQPNPDSPISSDTSSSTNAADQQISLIVRRTMELKLYILYTGFTMSVANSLLYLTCPNTPDCYA